MSVFSEEISHKIFCENYFRKITTHYRIALILQPTREKGGNWNFDVRLLDVGISFGEILENVRNLWVHLYYYVRFNIVVKYDKARKKHLPRDVV